jgi:hypothetical protein
MLFKKLFKLLVVSGALIGGTSGCAARAASDKKAPAPDAGTAADAGTKSKDTGGGASGW